MDEPDNFFENQTYCFSFPPTKNIMYQLRNTDCSYIVNPNNLDHYLMMLLLDQPKYILGLGSYSGVDQDKIRIETICTNQFRNKFDGKVLKQTKLNYLLKPNENLKLGKAMGNSHCNQVSWKIMELINGGELRSKYTFLHIPKSMPIGVATPIINQIIPLSNRSV